MQRSTRTELNSIEPIGALASYTAFESKVVTAHSVRVRVRALQEKYVSAADADAKLREHLRKAALDKAARLVGPPS